MYTFVFLWTPALSPNGEKVAHGMVFACFMMSCMAGSTLAGRLLSDPARHSVSHYMKAGIAPQEPLHYCGAILGAAASRGACSVECFAMRTITPVACHLACSPHVLPSPRFR